MMRIWLNFFKKPTMIICSLCCFVLIAIAFEPFLNICLGLLNDNKVLLNFDQLIHYLILPSTFPYLNAILSFAIDIIFLIIILYPLLQMLEFCLQTSPSIVVNKTGRRKWIKKNIGLVGIYGVIVAAIYILCAFIFFQKYDVAIIQNMSLIITILIKLMLILIAVGTCMLSFIYFNESFSAYFITIILYIFLSVVIGMFSTNIIDKNIIYNNYLILFGFLILLLLIVYYTIRYCFRRRDL